MASELPISPPGSQLDWYAKILGIGRGGFAPFPIIDAVLSTVIPTIDAFGSEKIAEVASAEQLGTLGAVELFHSAPLPIGPNAPRMRIYLNTEFWHDDVLAHQLRLGRIVVSATGAFLFVALTPSVLVPGDTGSAGGDNRLAARNITIGPQQNLAVRADAMGGGARLFMRHVFLEMQVGQYVRSLE